MKKEGANHIEPNATTRITETYGPKLVQYLREHIKRRHEDFTQDQIDEMIYESNQDDIIAHLMDGAVSELRPDEYQDHLLSVYTATGTTGDFSLKQLDYYELEKFTPREHQNRVLIIQPNQHPYVALIDNTLEREQEIVGGYIEAFTLDDDATIIVNEEGKLKELPPNRHYYDDILCGTIMIIGVDGDEFVSLTDEQISKYTEQFYEPETFTQSEIESLYHTMIQIW